MRWGALMQPTAMEVRVFVKVSNIINHASFGGCMLRGLVSAKGQLYAFPQEVDMALTTVPCATALACEKQKSSIE
jgi:hypothetical protein